MKTIFRYGDSSSDKCIQNRLNDLNKIVNTKLLGFDVIDYRFNSDVNDVIFHLSNADNFKFSWTTQIPSKLMGKREVLENALKHALVNASA